MGDSHKKVFKEIRKGGEFEEIGKRYGIHPLVARVMRNREIVSEEEIQQFLYGNAKDLHDPHLLKDADLAANIIKEEIEKGSHIRVIGDYDIDGVMSSYILVSGLRKLGANVSAQIPHRISDGYGLNRNLIEEAKADAIDCIITCDNGISAIDEIALAKEYGITVVVTDHHQVTVGIPEADAIVNPHQSDCKYPFKDICGATVAWKVLLILFELCELSQDVGMEYIENVGFATVGDIMPLTGENRILVKEGLRAINHTKNLGMKALITQCGLADRVIKAHNFGFVLGPCINATGRLDTASRALELFLTDQSAVALEIAQELVSLNEARKDLTAEGVEEAIRIYEEENYAADPIVVMYLKGVHESIAGIIAGRIREKYYKPTFILTDGEDCIKGSARSIEGYSLAEELSKHKDLFIKFGGHPKAAGLSIEKTRMEEFKRVINEDSPLSVEDEIETVYLDACPPFSYLSVEVVEQLSILEPFGNENRSPLFGASKLSVQRIWIMGKNQNVLKMMVSDGSGAPLEAISFNEVEQTLSFFEERFGKDEVDKALKGNANALYCSLIYSPKVNDFGGPHVQLEIKYYM